MPINLLWNKSCLFPFQMSVPKLPERLRADTRQFIRLSAKAFREKWELEDKFRLVANRLTAEPLGFCLLRHDVEYPILQIARWQDDVFVNVPLELRDVMFTYRQPTAYSELVSIDEIFQMNFNRKRYALVKVVHECDWYRLNFDHKPHTWDLELRRL